MDRRSFIAGFAALMTSAGGVSVAAPVNVPPECEIDQLARFAALFSRLGDDERAVFMTLLRALHALPEDANSDHLFAEARRQLAALPGGRWSFEP